MAHSEIGRHRMGLTLAKVSMVGGLLGRQRFTGWRRGTHAARAKVLSLSRTKAKR